jgi:hypothetical protein
MSEDDPKLGPCCICETDADVINILMLEHRGLVPGHGWGCLVCDLPNDGAVVVLCEACMGRYQRGEAPLRFFCRGYPASDGRAPFSELPPDLFDHDMTKHADD